MSTGRAWQRAIEALSAPLGSFWLWADTRLGRINDRAADWLGDRRAFRPTRDQHEPDARTGGSLCDPDVHCYDCGVDEPGTGYRRCFECGHLWRTRGSLRRAYRRGYWAATRPAPAWQPPETEVLFAPVPSPAPGPKEGGWLDLGATSEGLVWDEHAASMSPRMSDWRGPSLIERLNVAIFLRAGECYHCPRCLHDF